jgi:hypothetical protein
MSPEVTTLKNQITSFRTQLRDAERRLEEIRAKCSHRLVKMPDVSWGRDSFDLGVDTRLAGYCSSNRKQCEICGEIV